VLAAETAKFGTVNKFFINLMKKVEKMSGCLRFVRNPQNQGVLQQLINYNAVLEECNNRLEDYMQEKRQIFPRFFFLSNDELIDILANSQEIDIIQLHLKTLFDNLVKIDV
jgi:dynein heavy chain